MDDTDEGNLSVAAWNESHMTVWSDGGSRGVTSWLGLERNSRRHHERPGL
jgi:hypothetical protein